MNPMGNWSREEGKIQWLAENLIHHSLGLFFLVLSLPISPVGIGTCHLVKGKSFSIHLPNAPDERSYKQLHGTLSEMSNLEFRGLSQTFVLNRRHVYTSI
jgi:hypothetical protein